MAIVGSISWVLKALEALSIFCCGQPQAALGSICYLWVKQELALEISGTPSPFLVGLCQHVVNLSGFCWVPTGSLHCWQVFDSFVRYHGDGLSHPRRLCCGRRKVMLLALLPLLESPQFLPLQLLLPLLGVLTPALRRLPLSLRGYYRVASVHVSYTFKIRTSKSVIH